MTVDGLVVVVVVSSGGMCYRRCDGRVTMTNISHGALGSWRGAGVDGRRHAYCLFMLSVSAEQVTTSSTSVTLTVPPNNLHTACLRVCEAGPAS